MHESVSAVGGALMVAMLASSAAAQSMPSAGEAPQIRQGFGSTVAISGEQIIVGEPANRTTPGYVYAYERDASGEWAEAARLSAPQGENGDGFGGALAVDGDLLATSSAPGDSTPAAVFIYEHGSDGWTMVQRITVPEPTPGYEFGSALALSGDRLLVGAWAVADSAGAVYAFERTDDGAWTLAGTLTASDSTSGDRFGVVLDMEGDVALIGATRTDDQVGAVYVFRATEAGWTEEARLEARSAEDGDRFGSSLLLRDGVAFAGTYRTNGFVGAVFAFERDEESGEWSESFALQPFRAVPQAGFGVTLRDAGDELWVGAFGVNEFSGSVYRFTQDEAGDWTSARKLVPGDDVLDSSDFFGVEFDVEGDLAAVAAVGDDSGLGSVYVFERSGAGDWVSETSLYTMPNAMDPVVGGAVRCAEGEAADFTCNGVNLLSFVPVADLGGDRGVNLNDIWGWTDPETGDEWALVGRTDGTTFVNVTDPENPVVAANLPKTPGSRTAVWRDIKVYENHAYVVADGAGQHGVQVYDLTRLRDIDASEGPVTVEATALYTNVASVHNIVINTETGYAYAVGSRGGGETCGGGLHMIDIRTPEEPKFAGCFADPATGRQNTGYTHDAQCVVYHGPDPDYQGHEICIGSNETALSVADVSDKENPVAVARATYPKVGYTHQGWFDEQQHYFYLGDELDEMQGLVDRTRTLVWDLSDLDDPILVEQHLGTQPSIDHNLYIVGDLMYQSNYMSGLRILDISNREDPVEVAFFDTVPYGDNSPSFGGSWSNYPFFESGTIVVTSGSEGLFVLKKQEGAPVS